MTQTSDTPTSPFLKRAIAELDVSLEEELQRYQYWRKHGRNPQRLSQRSKKRTPSQFPKVPEALPPEPVFSTEPVLEKVPEPAPDPIAQGVATLLEEPIVPETEAEEENAPWLDWQTLVSGFLLMIALGVVGFLAAQFFRADQWLRSLPLPTTPGTPSPAPSPPSTPQSFASPAVTASPTETPISVTSEETLGITYKVVIEAEYLDRVRQIVPQATTRSTDGKIEVSFQSIEEAMQLVQQLLEQNIPATIE